MIISLLKFELRRDEAVRYVRYRDSMGNETIGAGHNLEVSPLPDGWIEPLNDGQVDTLLDGDIGIALTALDAHLPWWRNLDEVRQRVIANMCFNMGIMTLLEFHNTLHCMQTGDYIGAGAGMATSKWAEEVGQRAARLVTAMASGVMPDDPEI